MNHLKRMLNAKPEELDDVIREALLWWRSLTPEERDAEEAALLEMED